MVAIRVNEHPSPRGPSLALDHDLGNRLPFPFPRGLGRLDRSDASDGSLKLFHDPGIEAFAGNACRQTDLAMKLRRNARHELTREGLVTIMPGEFAQRPSAPLVSDRVSIPLASRSFTSREVRMNRLPAWHKDFLRMLPTIRQVAHGSLRHLHGHEEGHQQHGDRRRPSQHHCVNEADMRHNHRRTDESGSEAPTGQDRPKSEWQAEGLRSVSTAGGIAR